MVLKSDDQSTPNRIDPAPRASADCGNLPRMAVIEASSTRPADGVGPLESAVGASAEPAATARHPNRLVRWAMRDPVRAVATVLIGAHLLWRADIASRGFIAIDDFVFSTRAAGSALDAEYVLGVYGDHLMPAGALLYWLVVRAVGLSYWPYLLLLIIGQAVLSIAYFRLLRTLLPAGWGILIPLCAFLLTPLTLDATSSWIVGILILPMQLATILAIGAMVKYVRTRRSRHLISLSLSLILGLLFFEKALLIAPLVFLVTACLFVTGGPIRSIARTVRGYWPAWIVVTTVSVGYLALYLTRSSAGSVRAPSSVREVVTFVQHMVGHNLIPGVVGGPWNWIDTGDDFPPLVAPDGPLRWLTWIGAATLVAATVWWRPAAARAWGLLVAYAAIAIAVLAATRLGTDISGVAGLATRYIADVAVVAIICVGVACFGLQGNSSAAWGRTRTPPALLREPGAVAIALLLLFTSVIAVGVGTASSAAGFADAWAIKHGRDYLHTAQAELAAAPAGTVFFDQPVPENVVPSLSWPNNMQSRFFAPADYRPVFVTEAERPSVFDPAGHIRPADVTGVETPPGPEPGCGYQIPGGFTVKLLLNGSRYAWQWAVKIGYLSSGESLVTLGFGEGTRTFTVDRGLHQIIFLIEGGDDAVELRVHDPSVTVCIDRVTIGGLVAG